MFYDKNDNFIYLMCFALGLNSAWRTPITQTGVPLMDLWMSWTATFLLPKLPGQRILHQGTCTMPLDVVDNGDSL